MTFCSRCGAEYVVNAKFCHKCGNEASQAQNSGPINGGSGTTITTPTSSGSRGSSLSGNNCGNNASRLSFGAYRMRKEVERSSHFKSKGPRAKKIKTQPDNSKKAAVEVKVNVAIMVFKEGRLIPKRNTSLPLTVNDLIGKEELLHRAVDKQSRFNSVLISNEPRLYKLLFGNHARVQEVTTIPGSDEPFTLRRYKEEIGKPYSKICFFLCTLTDYLAHTINTSSSDEDEQPMPSIISPQSISNRDTASPMEPELPRESTHDEVQLNGDEIKVNSDNVEVPSDEVRVTLAEVREPTSHAQTVQCPLCLDSYPLEDIQVHANTCGMWLLNEDCDEVINIDDEEEEPNTSEITDMTNQDLKQNLKDEITQLAKTCIVNDTPRRITVRRKSIWEDFKNELRNKITPTTYIKVVFAGEPAVDDGGPRRELFSELLSIVKRRYFKDGKPIQSTMAISAGDFKQCGIVIGMSIMQGGPAANFMSHGVSCFFTGCKMLASDIRNPKYLELATHLSSATTDEQVQEILTQETTLDILQELGYTGVPYRETVGSVEQIVQSLCVKDQIGDDLAQLLEIKAGLEACGVSSETVLRKPQLWKMLFHSSSFFRLSADEILDEFITVFSDSQLKKDTEVDTYKYFCDTIQSIDVGGVAGLETHDLLKWMTGSGEVPPLGFPKKFQIKFIHGCNPCCKCRPTVSTCDLSVTMPVHIDKLDEMEEMLHSAVKDSHGFGNL